MLPSLNAFLNGSSALFLTVGYFCIRFKKVTAHKLSMVTAFMLSTVFLISYVIYHYHAGSVSFSGQGLIRPVYFTLLISHIVLAACIVPLALVTLYRAWNEQFERHKRIARVTLPVWLYVSVTGVVVYWMLYWLSPQ
jgi:putative membrane protein